MGTKRVFRSIGVSLALIVLFATGALAAMGVVENFTFRGFGPNDLVGEGESNRPDGRPDATFSISVSGFGAITGLLLRSEDHDSAWDTTQGNGVWGIHVKESSGKVLTESSGSLSMIPLLMRKDFELSVADNGAIARGGEFTLTARFIDNSESSATITIKPSVRESDVRLLSVRWQEKGPRDLTGRNENLRGDGRVDDRVRLELQGEGILESVEVRDIVDGNPTVAWDTIPGNGRWAIAVVEGNKMVNRSDGSINLRLSGRTVLDLWMTDNGVIEAGRSRFEVVLRFTDGSYLQGFIDGSASQGQSEGLEAAYIGEGDRDIVGRNETRSGNGKPDWRVDVKLENSGTVTGMKITNVKGPGGEWDTIPGNGKWLLAVTRPKGDILNRSDGSVRFPVTSSSNFVIWMENNGSLDKAETRSVLTVTYDDGRLLETEIKPYSAATNLSNEDFLEARLVGVGNYDYVGKNENLRADQSRDSRFDIRFRGRGTLNAIRLVNTTRGGEWDTIPGNGKWLIAVKQPDGSVLNASNGSVRLSVDGTASLELWVQDNGTLGDEASAFRVTLSFSDGSVLEKEIPARSGDARLDVDKDERELRLRGPRQASSSDYVGPYDRLQKNGKLDWYFSLQIRGKGTIKAMTLRNVGASGEWDTIPGNGRWTMAVRGNGDRILNKSNGSVFFSAPPEHNVYLFVEDNGTLQLSRSRYELVVTWDDGTTTRVHAQE